VAGANGGQYPAPNADPYQNRGADGQQQGWSPNPTWGLNSRQDYPPKPEQDS
jgi:hypothetical protein